MGITIEEEVGDITIRMVVLARTDSQKESAGLIKEISVSLRLKRIN
jgi:hypothetical protein